MSNIKFDHLLIRVDELKQTVTEFQQMGFKVYYGNAKPRCHHAMIYFRDGSFIEFIDQSAFPRILKFLARIGFLNLFGTLYQRISHYTTSSDRLLDYALYSPAISQFHDRVKKKAVATKLTNLNRVNHLNDTLTWTLFAFNDMQLPFVMSDYAPHKLPTADSTQHANGIEGIKMLTIKSPSTKDLIQKIGDLFELDHVSDNMVTVGSTDIVVTPDNKFEIESVLLVADRLDDQYDYSALSKYTISLASDSI